MLYPVPLLTSNYPSIYTAITKSIRPFHIFNSYGLFAVLPHQERKLLFGEVTIEKIGSRMNSNGSLVMWRKNRDLGLRTNLDWTEKCGSPLSEIMKETP